MNYLDLVLRWAHILSVIGLVGGTFFLQFVWLPSTAGMSKEERESSFASLRAPWSRIVMLTTLLLLVSGLVNAVRIITRYELSSPYPGLVLVKFVAAMLLFFFAARISGRSAKAVQFRESIGKWLMVCTVLSFLLVGTAGYMKLIDRTPKITSATDVESVEENPSAEVVIPAN